MPKARLINCDPETAEWIFISAILSKSVTYNMCINFRLCHLPL